jgi:hypothetical protein
VLTHALDLRRTELAVDVIVHAAKDFFAGVTRQRSHQETCCSGRPPWRNGRQSA